MPTRLRRSVIGSRTIAILDFLCRRGSAVDLDDHLRTLADNDALALENSYALTRFITWAIPILGFLGTVLGITGAISGVTPEKLETNLNSVTDGLALAFDATALALALTMIAMFTSFITERAEQAVLDLVDAFVDRELAHRFERGLPGSGAAVEAAQEQTNVVLKGMDSLVQHKPTFGRAAWPPPKNAPARRPRTKLLAWPRPSKLRSSGRLPHSSKECARSRSNPTNVHKPSYSISKSW